MLSNLLLSETCKFKLEPSDEQKRILEELLLAYTKMVQTCWGRALDLNLTSRKRLHEAVYGELRVKFPSYPSHYIYTAITHALVVFKSYRRLSRKRRDVKPPCLAGLRTVLLDDAHLFWFIWGNLKLSTQRGHIMIPFKVHEQAEKFRGWSVKGSRLVKSCDGYYLHVTFRREAVERKPEGLLGIDINEKSIDLAIVKPGRVEFIKMDISGVKYLRDRYLRKRRNIQSKTSGRTKSKLLSKYSGREKRRVNDILHRATKAMATIMAEEGVKPVMEELKNIRERINYGRKMNRRLHGIPFRRIQFYTAYKAMELGFKPEFVEARNTSRICPICGELNKPNGHVFKCGRCGFRADRHLVAAWNIAAKHPMWGALSLPPKAVDEAFKAEAERIVIKS